MIISCGSVNPSLLVRPRCLPPPSDLQVESCFRLCLLLKSLMTAGRGRTSCVRLWGFEFETFAIHGTGVCLDFEILLRSLSSLLVLTIDRPGRFSRCRSVSRLDFWRDRCPHMHNPWERIPVSAGRATRRCRGEES